MSIHYRVLGEGRPIVILHGWGLDHRVMLQAMEPAFEQHEGWKRIYVDLPGMGRSAPDQTIRNSDDMLATLLQFLDGLIQDEPFAVCGYSYGSLLARGIAHVRRSRVRGVFLCAPVVIADSSARDLPAPKVLRKDPLLMSRLSPEEFAEFEPMAVVQGEREWARFRDDILAPSRDADMEFMEKIRQNGYGFSMDLDADALVFECPALILSGQQDHVVGFKDAWRLIDEFPRATFAVLDMAGHNMQIERPALFEALVRDWLDRMHTY